VRRQCDYENQYMAFVQGVRRMKSHVAASIFQRPVMNDGSGISGYGTACGQARTKLV
jgi:hypothetical protein